jgi:molecular chaperone GrpE
MSKHPEHSPGPGAHEQQTGAENTESSQTETASSQPAPAGSPAETGCADAAVDAQAKIGVLEAEKADLNDKYLRKAAEFENYRKRMIKEKEDTRIYANTEILVDLVSLLDDFDRAIQSSEAGKDFKVLHDGISMIQKAFLAKLESRYGLKRYESVGEAFDPARHEAIMAEQRADIDQDMVIEDFMKGYCLHDRIIRPAKVKVATPAPQSGSPQSGSPPELASGA